MKTFRKKLMLASVLLNYRSIYRPLKIKSLRGNGWMNRRGGGTRLLVSSPSFIWFWSKLNKVFSVLIFQWDTTVIAVRYKEQIKMIPQSWAKNGEDSSFRFISLLSSQFKNRSKPTTSRTSIDYRVSARTKRSSHVLARISFFYQMNKCCMFLIKVDWCWIFCIFKGVCNSAKFNHTAKHYIPFLFCLGYLHSTYMPISVYCLHAQFVNFILETKF